MNGPDSGSLATFNFEGDDLRVFVEGLAELEPKAEAWEAMVDPSKDYCLGDAAKLLSRSGDIEIGRGRFFAWMRAGKHIFKEKDERGREYDVPYQKHVSAGKLSVKLGKPWWNDKDQRLEQGPPQVRIPGRALAYWLKVLRRDGRFTTQRQITEALVPSP